MAEYIERAAAIKAAERAYHAWSLAAAAAGPGEVYKRQELCKAVASVFDSAPAADVAPVVHGRWEEPDNFDLGFWQCSNCGFLSEAAAANRLYRYCCNCGAKMDGGADDGSERRSAGE